jgi:large subunit ribosomal protein L10e
MKAKNYRKAKGLPYTRRKFIHGAPQPKIVKFTMGDPSGNYSHRVSLLSRQRAQIRHNALEAARVATNRHLEGKLGQSYSMRILLYPHVILREHKMLAISHADRFQDGMKHSFGKAVGTAAKVEPDQSVITVNVDENGVDVAREALKRGAAKLPTKCRILIEKVMD